MIRSVFLGACVFALPFVATASPLPQNAEFTTPILDAPSEIVSIFGVDQDPVTGSVRFQTGINIGAQMGQPVAAPAAGEVVFAGHAPGYGRRVDLRVSETMVIRFGHLSSLSVSVGQTVDPGEIVGEVGSTGPEAEPHLHVAVKESEAFDDPTDVKGLVLISD
ncbi:MAG: M23 family metallopeptidase [Pseudomonadota bacterium]